jgi:heat shock protein 4
MMKPRPAPAKPATPEAPPTPPAEAGEQQPQGGDANADASANASANERAVDGSGEVPPASEEPMETEASTTSA